MRIRNWWRRAKVGALFPLAAMSLSVPAVQANADACYLLCTLAAWACNRLHDGPYNAIAQVCATGSAACDQGTSACAAEYDACMHNATAGYRWCDRVIWTPCSTAPVSNTAI